MPELLTAPGKPGFRPSRTGTSPVTAQQCLGYFAGEATGVVTQTHVHTPAISFHCQVHLGSPFAAFTEISSESMSTATGYSPDAPFPSER